MRMDVRDGKVELMWIFFLLLLLLGFCCISRKLMECVAVS